MAKRFVLDLGEPYQVVVPVSIPQDDEVQSVEIVVLLNHLKDSDLSDSASNYQLVKRIVHSVKECFEINDSDGEPIKNDDLLDFLAGFGPTQNAIISSWRESQIKKNLRLT